MPLRAHSSTGEELIAPLMSQQAWDEMVAAVRAHAVELTMPCCHVCARPRVSPLGTPHFFHHRRGECESQSESAEHLALKAAVVEHFAGRGWGARPEVAGDGWIADVLASHNDRRVVVEIQLSPQDADTTAMRTARYRDAGLSALWLMRRLPAGLRGAGPRVIAFELASERRPFLVRVEDRAVGLSSLLDACIERRLRLRAPELVPSASVALRTETVECRSCGRFFGVAYGSFERRCVCGRSVTTAFDAAVEAGVDRLVAEAVAEVPGSPRDPWIPALAAPEVVEQLAPGDPYMRGVAADCPACGKQFGLAFHRGVLPGEPVREVDLPDQAVPRDWARHWCLR